MRANAEKRSVISGSGFFSWKDKQTNIAAPGVLLVSWPDRLRLEVQDPIGGTQALLVVNGESFWWYSAQEKEIFTGRVARLQQALGFSFMAQDLVQAFLARSDFSLNWMGDDCSYCVQAVEKGLRQRLYWSDRLNEVVEWEKNFSGRRRGVVSWEDFMLRLGVSFPRKTRLDSYVNGELEQSISWVWNEWQPSLVNDKNLFEIPQKERFGRKIKILP